MAEFAAVGFACRDIPSISGPGIHFIWSACWPVYKAFPDEIYEAGTIDGANGPQLFRYVTLPQLRPIIISLAMLDFYSDHAAVYADLDDDGRRAGPRTEMLSTFTYKLAFSTYEFSLASTSAMVILVLSMFVALFYVRRQRAS